MEEEQDDMKIEDLLNYMLALFKNTENSLKREREKLGVIDTELSDLDHFIENRNLKAGEYAKVGKLRKELRQERRQIKYNIDNLNTVKRFTDKYNNKLIVGDLILLKKELEQLEDKHNNPTYVYKTDILQRGGLVDGFSGINSVDNIGVDAY